MNRLTRARAGHRRYCGSQWGTGARDPDLRQEPLSSVRICPSDNRAGLFLADLVRAGGGGDAETFLLASVGDDTDPYSTLAAPLLDFAKSRDVAPRTGPEADALALLLAVGTDGQLNSANLRSLRASFDRLARFERREGSKLNSMRRMMLLGCFVVHVHVISRWSEVEAGAPRPPILLECMTGNDYRSATPPGRRSALAARRSSAF